MRTGRPLSVTIIGWLFIGAGTVGVAYHGSELDLNHPFQKDLIWVLFIRLLAIVSGVFLLRGNNWARWLLVVWIGYHVILSGFHSLLQLIVHGLLLAVVAYFLLRKQTSEYFRRPNGPTQLTKPDDAHAD